MRLFLYSRHVRLEFGGSLASSRVLSMTESPLSHSPLQEESHPNGGSTLSAPRKEELLDP